MNTGFPPSFCAAGRLWQVVRADLCTMAGCFQLRRRDLDDSGLSQLWGRFPERLADGRDTATHLRHC